MTQAADLAYATVDGRCVAFESLFASVREILRRANRPWPQYALHSVSGQHFADPGKQLMVNGAEYKTRKVFE